MHAVPVRLHLLLQKNPFRSPRMKGTLRRVLARFPASILLLVLLLISMWANRQYTKQIEDLCVAGGLLYQEGSVAWEGLYDLAPGNLERDEERWRWARDAIGAHCPGTTHR